MFRNPVPPLVLLAGLVAIAGAWWLFDRTEAGRYESARQVAHSRSEIRLSMVVRHEIGPIAQERYQMSDLDGLSSSEYRAVGRDGISIRVESLPHETTDVSFFFDKTVQDGIWEITDQPPRGDTSTQYTLSVSQLTDNQHGSRTVTFTDPHYWATTGGHQFKLHLDRNKPVPNLLTLSGKSLVDPRYQKLVDDFRNFGSPTFRARIAGVQARLERRT